jgi:hypothetical protein
MASKEKRLERIRRSPYGWAPDVLERLVEAYGFECRGGTKHVYYVDPDEEANIVRIPRHKPVKEYVVQQVIAAIDKRLDRQER